MDAEVKYRSCFDIIGPIMIGPSSSHTAGACAIGYACYKLFGKVPDKVKITYYESFAATHRGHGTDFALISGLLGFSPSDDRVPYALEIARNQGMEISFVESDQESPAQHANTACLLLSDNDGNKLEVLGVSIGGGAMEIRKIEKQGFIVEPKETRNLVMMEWYEEFDLELFRRSLNKLDAELLNYQEVNVGNMTIVLFNPKRCLSKLELDALLEASKASGYTTLMDCDGD